MKSLNLLNLSGENVSKPLNQTKDVAKLKKFGSISGLHSIYIAELKAIIYTEHIEKREEIIERYLNRAKKQIKEQNNDQDKFNEAI